MRAWATLTQPLGLSCLQLRPRGTGQMPSLCWKKEWMTADPSPAFCSRPRPFLGSRLLGASFCGGVTGLPAANLGEPFEWVSGLVSFKKQHLLEGPALALFL